MAGCPALVVAVGLLSVGCTLGCAATGTSPAPTAVADASRVDMCTVVTTAELTRIGVSPSTRQPVEQGSSAGCEWVGDQFILSLERDRARLVSYRTRQRPAFIAFAENTVNGRAGVTFRVDRDGVTDCEQLMDGGPVSLVVGVSPQLGPDYRPVDSCAEALRIAQLIEQRLPKAGG
ncbi:MAG: DUF3558 family protein [Pseudonocardiaceae bacterium]